MSFANRFSMVATLAAIMLSAPVASASSWHSAVQIGDVLNNPDMHAALGNRNIDCIRRLDHLVFEVKASDCTVQVGLEESPAGTYNSQLLFVECVQEQPN